ncbi:conserved hypothetical protein, membrane [Candidatus Magnetomorum sp. HK-1]|nr:conserved hypothetical protein, membrane [Candidatus Magnetomorum sp. HK-1]
MNVNDKNSSLAGGVFLAYSIIIMHALIIALLFMVIIFFRGIVHYMFWVVLAGIGFTFISGWYFFRRLKKNSQKLKDLLNDPAFSGRTLEIAFLGGSAVFKVSARNDQPFALGYEQTMALPPPDNAKNNSINDLQKLSDLLENKRITEEEYQRLKAQILNNE